MMLPTWFRWLDGSSDFHGALARHDVRRRLLYWYGTRLRCRKHGVHDLAKSSQATSKAFLEPLLYPFLDFLLLH